MVDNKNTLTKQIIHNTFVPAGKTHKEFSALLIISIIVLIISSLIHVILVLLFGFLSLAVIIFLLMQHQVARKIEKNEYFIYDLPCHGKHVHHEEDPDGSSYDNYYLDFDFGSVKVHFPHIVKAPFLLPINLYDDAEIGDRFYLVCSTVHGKERFLYIFNQKYWVLDMNEFQLYDETFYTPVK